MARKLSPRGRRTLFVINSLIILATLGLTLHGTWLLTVLNLDQSSPAINLPYAYVYSSGIVGMAGMAIIVVGNLYKLLTARMSDDDLIMTVDTEEMIDPSLAGETK